MNSRNNNEITFAIHIDNPEQIQAFGLSVGFPDNILSFDHVSSGELTDGWQMLEGKESLAGVVNIGGFDEHLIRSTEAGNLAYITFRAKQGVYDQGELWMYGLSDDISSAETKSVPFTTLPSGVRMLQSGNIPDVYRLEQNYPNPFNLATEIVYQLPEPADVNLSLYNYRGQKIRTLVSQKQSAGRYAVHWDGRDENGSVVSSGVYLYKLRTKNFTSIKKLILIK